MTNSETSTVELGSADGPSLADDHDVMINQIETSIDELVRKIESGRIVDPEKDRTRIKYHRALANALRTKADLIEQRELEEMHQELQRLKRERQRRQQRGG